MESSTKPVPCTDVLSGKLTNGDTYVCAVATTSWGKIPGRARGTKCWYPYGGSEFETTQFKYIFSYFPLKYEKYEANNPSILDKALLTGCHNTGNLELYSAIANTEFGRIPGKASSTNCWYSYDGKEYSTQDFDYIVYDCPNSPPYGGQNDPATCGQQYNGEVFYCAVADTKYGKIPCKANDEYCYYPYGGRECLMMLDNVKAKYLTSDTPLKRVKNDGSQPPGAVASGYQTDGGGEHFSAIATDGLGDIPGKAKGNMCWYSIDGRERSTNQFDWIVNVNVSK